MPPRTPLVWGWAVAGALLGMLCAVLVFAPARWLGAGVAQFSNGHLRMSEAQGTLWNGSAALTLTGGADSTDAVALPSRLQWRISVHWGHAAVRLQAECCTSVPLALTLTPRWGQLDLAVGDGQSVWPAQLLAGLGTPWNTLQLQGELALSSQNLTLNLTPTQWRVSGNAQLQARGVTSSLTTLRPMGSYQLKLLGGAAPRLLLNTLSGSLELAGEGQWVGSRLRFNGEARAQAGHEAELSNLLNIMGRRDGARSLITLG